MLASITEQTIAATATTSPSYCTSTTPTTQPLPPLETFHKPSQTKHPRRYASTLPCCILSLYVFLVMVYVYMNNMMVIMQFLLSLVMLEDMGDEFECDQMN